jgi:hypothetical protein
MCEVALLFVAHRQAVVSVKVDAAAETGLRLPADLFLASAYHQPADQLTPA